MSFGDHGQVPGTCGAFLALYCLIGIDGCKDDGCRCRCHAQLSEEDRQRIRLAVAEASRIALDKALNDRRLP